MAPLFEGDPEGFFEILNAGIAQGEGTQQQQEQIRKLAATDFGLEDPSRSDDDQQPTQTATTIR